MTATSVQGGAASGKASRAGKYLTFFLGEEEFGLEILKVHEIIGNMPITRVPRTPHYIRGVVNLRGKIIPLVDLRRKFSMEDAPDGATCIIVVQVHGIPIGIVVDRVSEVVTIAARDIEDTPAFGSDVDTEYLLGVAKAEERVKLLLDIDRVLSTDDVRDVTSVQAPAGQSEFAAA